MSRRHRRQLLVALAGHGATHIEGPGALGTAAMSHSGVMALPGKASAQHGALAAFLWRDELVDCESDARTSASRRGGVGQ